MLFRSKYFINKYSPLQIGAKDIYIKEEFAMESEEPATEKAIKLSENKWIYYKEDYSFMLKELYSWQPASQMTKEQSRYSINEVIDMRAARATDINTNDMLKLGYKYDKNCFSKYDDIGDQNYSIRCSLVDNLVNGYNTQLKEQNINRTYEDDDYIILMEIK